MLPNSDILFAQSARRTRPAFPETVATEIASTVQSPRVRRAAARGRLSLFNR